MARGVKVDLPLAFPFIHRQGHVAYQLHQPFGSIQYRIPECVDSRVGVIDDCRPGVFTVQQASTGTATPSIWLDIDAALATVQLDDVAEEPGENLLPARVSQWTKGYGHIMSSMAITA